MSPIDKDALRENIARLPFNYSTYVALAIVYALDWWADPANAQAKASLLQSMPWLGQFKEAIAVGLWLLSRAWPQQPKMPGFTPPPAGTGVSGEVIGRAGDFSPTVPQLTPEEIDALLRADQILKSRARGSA